MKPIEQHPLGFFLPANAKLLMLGSFPPKRERWSMDFFYPNLQNDMWRIFGLLFFGDKNHFLTPNLKSFDKERLIAFLQKKGIALGDTAQEVIRLKDNASDQFLEVITPIDLRAVLAPLPDCRALVLTGQKALDTLLPLIAIPKPPKIGSFSEFTFENRTLRLYRMPSSSRAYPKSLKEKADTYYLMFKELGII